MPPPSTPGQGDEGGFGPSVPPNVKGAVGDVQELFNAAYKDALARLDTHECAQSYASGPEVTVDKLWLQRTLDQTKFYYEPVTQEGGNRIALTPGGQEVLQRFGTRDDVVPLNSLVNAWTLKDANQVGTWWGMSSTDISMTASQVRTFTLLHELMHVIGFGGSIDGPNGDNYNTPENKAILQNCLGIQLQ